MVKILERVPPFFHTITSPIATAATTLRHAGTPRCRIWAETAPKQGGQQRHPVEPRVGSVPTSASGPRRSPPPGHRRQAGGLQAPATSGGLEGLPQPRPGTGGRGWDSGTAEAEWDSKGHRPRGARQKEPASHSADPGARPGRTELSRAPTVSTRACPAGTSATPARLLCGPEHCLRTSTGRVGRFLLLRAPRPSGRHLAVRPGRVPVPMRRHARTGTMRANAACSRSMGCLDHCQDARLDGRGQARPRFDKAGEARVGVNGRLFGVARCALRCAFGLARL